MAREQTRGKRVVQRERKEKKREEEKRKEKVEKRKRKIEERRKGERKRRRKNNEQVCARERTNERSLTRSSISEYRCSASEVPDHHHRSPGEFLLAFVADLRSETRCMWQTKLESLVLLLSLVLLPPLPPPPPPPLPPLSSSCTFRLRR